VIEQIAAYLRTYKAKRAASVLRDYVRLTPRNGKYTADLARRREVFIERFLRIRPRAQGRPNRAVRS
jgi:hypothetical protein